MKSSPPFRLVLTVFLVTVATVMLGTCQKPVEPEVVESPPSVYENPELRLRLAGVPEGLIVITNDGDQVILEPADAAKNGRILLMNMPPEAGQNLPAEVKAHQIIIENQEGGSYLGGQELISQLGTSYYSRGRYLENGVEIEETVVFSLHPDADRIMTITYRYQAGDDSGARVQELFDVLAVVEGLG